MSKEKFTVGELAAVVTGGSVRAMTKLLNDAGAGLDETVDDPTAQVDRAVVVDLWALRAGDRVGRLLSRVLREGVR